MKYVDGLRGCAAAAVVIQHVVTGFYPVLNTGRMPEETERGHDISFLGLPPFRILYNGVFSVYLFFVLSGFVLPYKYFSSKDSSVVTTSTLRRYIRLGLPSLVASFIPFIMMECNLFVPTGLPEHSWITNYPPKDATFLTLLRESLFAMWVRGGNMFNAVMWTMRHEFVGSLLVYLFAPAMTFVKYPYALCLLCFAFCLAPPVASDTYFYAPFFLGMALSYFHAHGNTFSLPWVDKVAASKITFWLCLLLGVWCIFLPLDIRTPWWCVWISDFVYIFTDFINAVTYTVASALILFAIIHSPRLQKVFSSRICVFLGKVSFAVYLYHMLVHTTVLTGLFRLLYVEHGWNYDLAVLLGLVVDLPVVFIVGYVMTRLVDAPAIRLAAYVVNKVKRSQRSSIDASTVTVANEPEARELSERAVLLSVELIPKPV
eukprot:GILJ01012719.1.p1 GENE.GILJ01012719.1~~GILJ01012719.1.p1  ORF type:complete len:430 (+),score=34.97 GILJ01012719.1:3-1292(+)